MFGDLLSLLLRRSMRSLLYLSPLSLLSKFVSDLGAFAFVCIVAPSPVFLENEPMIEFDRNQNPLRDELLTNHKWTVSDDGTLEVPMKRLVDILPNSPMIFFLKAGTRNRGGRKSGGQVSRPLRLEPRFLITKNLSIYS